MTGPAGGQPLFDRWASDFETGRLSRWFQHYQTRVLDRAEDLGAGDLLDVGCGTGWLVRSAARRFPGPRRVGVDLSAGMVGAARRIADRAGLEGVTFLEADSARLPILPGSFDLITCTASFHHYRDPGHVLSAWRKILRAGGHFLLLETCATYLPVWAIDKVLRLFEKGHVRYYREVDLVRLAEEAGFRNVRTLWRERGMFVKGKLFSSVVLVEGEAPG